MVKINGKEMDVAGKTVGEFIRSSEYNNRRIAVECNCEIVPRVCYDQTVLKDGDTVEIVSFVGGG